MGTLCMQKQVIQFKRDSVTRQVPYIAQTTPFTCGPASLLMAFNYFKPGLFNPYQHEIELSGALNVFTVSANTQSIPMLVYRVYRSDIKGDYWGGVALPQVTLWDSSTLLPDSNCPKVQFPLPTQYSSDVGQWKNFPKGEDGGLQTVVVQRI